MRQLRPQYRGQDGQLVDEPLTAAGAAPSLDLDGLARLFTGPALSGEFMPSSFVEGVELVWQPVAPTPTDAPLSEVFAAAVAELCADAMAVGVSLSGGLDSLAVLAHVLALRPRRRVLAFVVDLVDDTGRSAADAVRRLLADLDVTDHVRLAIVDPEHCATAPDWSPHGPRLDALPVVNASVARLAREAGAEVLLSGDGADELLAVPRFATAQVLRRFGILGARRYLADMAAAGPGILGELLAMAGHVLPPSARTRVYWAANWPEWSPPAVSGVLAEPLRDAARAWACHWVDATLDAHAAARRSWAAADAFDAWWPRNYRAPTGSLPEVSPFLHPDVVATAVALPLSARYHPGGNTTHQRAKAQVIELFPRTLRSLLPDRKRTYRAALAASVAGRCDTPIATAIGLLDAGAVAREADTATRMTVAAVECWLAGAVTAGIRMPW
ncbi:MAG TPA: asparagine synthase C-terminal domain-containing protein [Pseudonocardiaceae bacterium]|nr:asparagine synthase C-terminal domain-containing protein [Pseudonocardiaceae bacterium]